MKSRMLVWAVDEVNSDSDDYASVVSVVKKSKTHEKWSGGR